MRVVATEIPDVLIFEPAVVGDDRGFFLEAYNERVFRNAVGRVPPFVQDNHSHSARGVLRGLHYQLRQSQGKLVRVVSGSVFDVAVDLRRGSATYGRWTSFEVSAHNRRVVWIPEGFAHGFLVLSETADVLYKATEYYAPQHERTIRWDDEDLAIAWPLDGLPRLSAKDRAGLRFRDADPCEPGPEHG
jgi:dTDP-4-dehydrorhamnose 3,5-epimerase